MRLSYTIEGSYIVPDGTTSIAGTENLFRLPTGQIVSVQPVIEIETGPGTDDHRDLTTTEGLAVGVQVELYERWSTVGHED